MGPQAQSTVAISTLYPGLFQEPVATRTRRKKPTALLVRQGNLITTAGYQLREFPPGKLSVHPGSYSGSGRGDADVSF